MALILGHSQAKYFADIVSNEDTMTLYFSGARVEDLLRHDIVRDCVANIPVVAVICGINNVYHQPRLPSQLLIDRFEEMFDEMRKINPSVMVILSSILPVATNLFKTGTHYDQSTIDRINAITKKTNDGLLTAANLTPGLHFIEHSEFFDDNETSRSLLSHDGLHLSRSGTKLVAHQIEETIEHANNLQTIKSNVPSYSDAVRSEPLLTAAHHTHNVTAKTVKYTKNIDAAKTVAREQIVISKRQRSRHWRFVKNERSAQCTAVKRTSTSVTHVQQESRSSKRHSPSGNVQGNRFMVLSVEETIDEEINSETIRTSPLPQTVHKVNNSKHTKNRKNRNSKHTKNRKNRSAISGKSCQVGGGETDTANSAANDDIENNTPTYSTTDRILSAGEVLDIILYPESSGITHQPPFRPGSGKVYVYDDGGDGAKTEDWRCDGYTWRNNGKRIIEINDNVIEKTFFKIRNGKETSTSFQRYAYKIAGSKYNGRTVIVYLGDSSVYKPMPHGNRLKNRRIHKRTMPSVLQKIKDCHHNEPPASAKRKIDSETNAPVNLEGIACPRNAKQIKNQQAKIRNDAKLSHDSLYALHLLAHQLDGYIMEIKTTPDIQVMIGMKDTFEEFDRLLQIKDEHVSLYYDTTFCLGDFYVSTLAFRHFMFEEKPIIPLGFMIHERKFQKCHEQFVNIMKEKIPRLGRTNVTIITDREAGIINAFEKCLDKSQMLICWNHILRDVRFWLNKHGATGTDKQVYVNHVRDLLQCDSHDEFIRKYEIYRQLWSEPMDQYFENELSKTITSYSGKWILEKFDCYNPYSGITNNCSESLNSKLKRLIEWKQREIDTIVLYLYYMQSNDQFDMINGFCGEGELTLLKKYNFAQKDPDLICLPKRVYHPDKMIELVRGERDVLLNPTEHRDDHIPVNDPRNQATGDVQRSEKTEPIRKANCSQSSLAAKTIHDKGITLVPEFQSFMVKGSTGKQYAVKLFPKESCNCASTSRCFHILAAMMAIGMDIPHEKKPMNLTQLRKNCRPRNQKRAGTKKGRKDDTDQSVIIAAPDSIYNKSASTPSNAKKTQHTKINIKI